MDIKSISTLSLPQSQMYQKTQTAASSVKSFETTEPETNKRKKSFKKLPYVAAGIVLAGLGVYASRNKLAKLFSGNVKKDEVDKVFAELNAKAKKEEAGKIHEKMREIIDPNILPQNRNNTIKNMKIILPEGTVKVKQQATEQVTANEPAHAQRLLPLLAPKQEKFVCIGFSEGKPVYEKLENIVEKNVQPAKSVVEEMKKSLNLVNDEVIAKIMKNRQQNASEIDRIIGENTHGGHINLNIMRKVAHDFSTDEAGRGADRFHQAADILEQSYIREFVKKDGKQIKGLYNLYDFMKTDSELFSIYTQMPMEEAANRLHYLRYNDLFRGGVEKDMTPDAFFEKMFEKLVQKTQFNGYNKAHEGMVVKVGV